MLKLYEMVKNTFQTQSAIQEELKELRRDLKNAMARDSCNPQNREYRYYREDRDYNCRNYAEEPTEVLSKIEIETKCTSAIYGENRGVDR